MHFTYRKTLLIIVLIATLTQIMTDLYTPSLPAIATYFHVALGQSQATMSAFIIGVAITTLIYGPLSEVIGRRHTVIIGMLIGLVGTGLCLFAPTIHVLYTGRLIQGCGMGACSALWRPIFRDSFSGDDLVKVGGLLVVALTLSAVLSPLVGGLIQQSFGWHANFVTLLIWLFLMLGVAAFFLKESSQHHGTHRMHPSFIVKTYGSLFMDRQFMGCCLIALLSYGGLFAWLTAGPVILIHGMHVQPAHFGTLLILTGLSTGLSGVLGGKMVKQLSQKAMLILGLFLMMLAGAVLLIGNHYVGLSITLVMIAAMIYMFGSTFVFLNCFAIGFHQVANIAGYAGSLYACIQLLGGFLFSAILGFLNSSHPAPMAWMFVASGIASLIMYGVMLRSTHETHLKHT